jgi:hypothetical protein
MTRLPSAPALSGRSPQPLNLLTETFLTEMPLATEHEYEQESGPGSYTPRTRNPLQPIVTSQSRRLTRGLSAPPPYSSPVTPSVPEAPFPVTLKLSRLASRPEVPSRPLPLPPDLETANFVEQVSHQPQHISHTHVANSPPTRRLRSPSVPTTMSPSPYMYSLPPPPPPPPTIPSVPQSPPRNANLRSAFRSFKLSKSSRNATTQITNAARHAGQDAQEEELARQATARDEAKSAVQSSIMSLLLTRSTDDERKSILSACGRICESGGLKLSTVLQEPLIEGQTALYWAILNRPRTSSQDDNAAWDALVVSLLDECGGLTETTVNSVRLACMLTSNNVLLQYLSWHFRALSPLTTGDIMMLRPLGGGDIVDVEETQDGSGTFVAHIKIRRFRLRMRVSKSVRLEFVTSGGGSYHS